MVDTILQAFGVLWCATALGFIWLVVDSITFERAYKRGYDEAAKLVESLEGIDQL